MSNDQDFQLPVFREWTFLDIIKCTFVFQAVSDLRTVVNSTHMAAATEGIGERRETNEAQNVR